MSCYVSVAFRRVQRLWSGNDGGGVLWYLGWCCIQQTYPHMERNRPCCQLGMFVLLCLFVFFFAFGSSCFLERTY